MAGEALWTKDHEIIRRWAEERGVAPAAASEAQSDADAMLRLTVDPDDESHRRISWEEFFRIFDEQDLRFVYRETCPNGTRSAFYRFDRELRSVS